MSKLNEIKDQQTVVQSVGAFANSLQQISASRMVKLRDSVIAARRFVKEATVILRELQLEKTKQLEKEQQAAQKSNLPLPVKPLTPKKITRSAIIVITSNQGLCGSYNTEIIRKMDSIIPKYRNFDYFVIGNKGQEYFKKAAKKFGIRYYPYHMGEDISLHVLKPLVNMFYYYDQIYLVYSRYLNTSTHEVDFIELAVPHVEEVEIQKEQVEGKYIFEPNLDDLIKSVNAKLRTALFRQQILDSKLSLYSSQMIAMQTASENAKTLMGELQIQYNKARRKLVDKKIQEVQAGRSLWANDEAVA